MSKRNRIRVGVIGVGAMGLHHARNYADSSKADLVAVADPDMSRAKTAASRFDCHVYNDYRTMLEKENLDAVSVAVPTVLHRAIAMDTLSARVHTLVEKPIANNLAEASELVEASHKFGVKLAVGHVERFNPALQELKRRVKAYELGGISSVVARRVGVMPPRVKDVDVILDLAVHDIDVLMYLLDQEPSEVAASAGSALLTNNRLDHSEIFMKFGNIGCFIQANWITPIKIRTLSVTGDAGHAELNYVTQRLEIYQSNLARQFDDFGDFVVRFGTPQTIAADLTPQEPLRLELESFLSAVDGNDSMIVTGEEGTRALFVAERVRAAVQTRLALGTMAELADVV